MRLYLLKPIDESTHWMPWFDKAFGFVVRAASETDARAMAAADAGDEGAATWLDATFTQCVELADDGKPGVIIQEFASA